MTKKQIVLLLGTLIGVWILYSIARNTLYNFSSTPTRMDMTTTSSSTGVSLPTNGGAYGFNSLGSFKSESTADRIMPVEPPANSGIANVPQSERKIIKTGSLSIVVKDVEQTVQKITTDTTAIGGYVSTTNFSNTSKGDATAGYIRVRIPADKVPDIIRSVKGTAIKVKSENISSQDVTSEYIDLQARIKNLEISETQYQEFMKKATNVTEVLTVQRELTSIRGQIEQLKGQMQYLEGNAEMSDITINIALDESELPIQQTDAWKPGYVFSTAWSQVIAMAKTLSYLAIYIATFAVIWVPISVGLWFAYKFYKKRIH